MDLGNGHGSVVGEPQTTISAAIAFATKQSSSKTWLENDQSWYHSVTHVVGSNYRQFIGCSVKVLDYRSWMVD